MDNFEQPHHPLLNIHILENIFHKCSDTRTLLNCRLVCQTWNSEAIRVMEHYGSHHHHQVTALVKGENAIEKFLNCMKTSENGHPYSSFSIELPARALEEDFEFTKNLILLLKDRMRHVKFDYEMPKSMNNHPEEDNLLDLNLDLESLVLVEPEELFSESSDQETITLPNLTSLHLFSTNIFPPKFSNRLPKLFDSLKTPHLSNLSVQHLYSTECAGTVAKLLCPSQISSLRMPCTEFPKMFQLKNSSMNLACLKELDVCDLFHGSFAKNETLQCIRENCPNLSVLAIELGMRVTFEAVFKLFETLSHSLVNLKLIIQDKNLLSRTVQRVNFRFPHMPKLQTLFLRYANPGLVYYIDEMPLLTSLELETPWTRKVRGQLLPGLDIKLYDKLETLKLSDKLTVQDVQGLRRIFPNLKSLCSSFSSNEAFGETCSNFGDRLECLIVDRNSCVGDTGICGFSSLEEFGKFSDEELFLNSNNMINTDICGDNHSKSIADLKRLKCLKLVQLGITWKSMILGVSHLSNLQSLAVQATTLKLDGGTELHKDDRVLKHLARNLLKLRNISIWIRKNSERFIPEEMEFIGANYPQWKIEFILQTVCSLT